MSAERVPMKLALSKADAANALGVSVDFLEEHVMQDLRIVRRGRRRLIPLAEWHRGLEANAPRTIDSWGGVNPSRRTGSLRGSSSVPAATAPPTTVATADANRRSVRWCAWA